MIFIMRGWCILSNAFSAFIECSLASLFISVRLVVMSTLSDFSYLWFFFPSFFSVSLVKALSILLTFAKKQLLFSLLLTIVVVFSIVFISVLILIFPSFCYFETFEVCSPSSRSSRYDVRLLRHFFVFNFDIYGYKFPSGRCLCCIPLLLITPTGSQKYVHNESMSHLSYCVGKNIA